MLTNLRSLDCMQSLSLWVIAPQSLAVRYCMSKISALACGERCNLHRQIKIMLAVWFVFTIVDEPLLFCKTAYSPNRFLQHLRGPHEISQCNLETLKFLC